jgi:hypothetical protein
MNLISGPVPAKMDIAAKARRTQIIERIPESSGAN